MTLYVLNGYNIASCWFQLNVIPNSCSEQVGGNLLAHKLDNIIWAWTAEASRILMVKLIHIRTMALADMMRVYTLMTKVA